jgi:2,3-bisphosphoglycerate-independent phosphoglycerate mutase
VTGARRAAGGLRARRAATMGTVTVLFVFVDGVGAGAADPDRNPLARGEFLLSRFADGSGAPLPAGGRAALADATLGVPGRPQSATGQTAILTGENAPRLLGRHLLGFPNATLRALLRERSLFLGLARAGRRAVFANAYPVAYLRALGLAADGEPEFDLGRRRARPAATTVAYAAGGGAFRTWGDARAGRGLTHDITGGTARRRGADVPAREPEEAADVFLALARGHDLALFEFFETDEAGHARSMDAALDALGRLDAFLRRLAARLGADDALVVASDHGNLEDLGTRNHTLSPVPVLGFGRAAAEVAAVRDLTHLAPLLARLAGAGALPPPPPSS